MPVRFTVTWSLDSSLNRYSFCPEPVSDTVNGNVWSLTASTGAFGGSAGRGGGPGGETGRDVGGGAVTVVVKVTEAVAPAPSLTLYVAV
ncbi:MAG: hypothetical protein F4156_16420 [Holophagales bacterium]|nr:hypothetical protein [Holophagales bacterium]